MFKHHKKQIISFYTATFLSEEFNFLGQVLTANYKPHHKYLLPAQNGVSKRLHQIKIVELKLK
jgi:hypothetical protein